MEYTISFAKGTPYLDRHGNPHTLKNPVNEVVINNGKYNHNKGILYTILDAAKAPGPWSLYKWCDRVVSDVTMIRAFLESYVATFGAAGRKNRPYADKLFKLQHNIPEETTGRVIFNSVLKDKMILAFEHLGNYNVRRKYVLNTTLRFLGATEEDAFAGYAPHPITRERMYMQGILGDFLAMNCPHSQMFWNKMGDLDGYLPGEHEALFMNPTLGEKHAANAWMPAKGPGGGTYSYDPEAARAVPRPPQEVLEAANALRKPGINKNARHNGPSVFSRTAATMSF